MNGGGSKRISTVLLSEWLCACLGPEPEVSCRLREAGAEEVSLIRYAGIHGGNGFEIRAPQCGYEASVVGMSGTLPVRIRPAPEGVEP